MIEIEKNLRENIYHNIKSEIVRGTYKNVDRLNEKDLVNKYKVSKAPVRDALIELCNEGVLRSIPRYGYQIVNYSDDYLKGIIRFRKIVEIKYLDLFWESLGEKEIYNLESLHTSQTTDVDKEQIENYWKSNQDFHLKLASFYKDEYFYENLKNAMTKQMVVFAQFYWDHWDKSVFNLYSHQHDAFIQAIKEGDREKAFKELEYDIDSFIKK